MTDTTIRLGAPAVKARVASPVQAPQSYTIEPRGDVGTSTPSDDPPVSAPPLATAGDPPVGPSSVPAAVVIVAAVAASGILYVAGFALYSRFNTAQEVLASPQRQRLLALVRARAGGVPLAQAVRELGQSRTTTLHHARVLARASLLVERRENGGLVFYSPGAAPAACAEARMLCPVTWIEIGRRMAQHARPMTRDEIHAAAVAIPRRTRNHALRRMMEAGMLVERREGFRTCYEPSPRLLGRLA